MTIERDYFKHVWKCHLYQVYADRISQPPAPLHNMASTWPFLTWGMDAIGMINPKASYCSILDAFNLWVIQTLNYVCLGRNNYKFNCYFEKEYPKHIQLVGSSSLFKRHPALEIIIFVHIHRAYGFNIFS